MKQALCWLFVFALALPLALPAAAGVTVERSPLPSSEIQPPARRGALPNEGGSSLAAAPRDNRPSGELWFAPRYFVNTTDFAETTLWAVRNEGTMGTVSLTVQYFDVFFAPQRVDSFMIDPHAVKTVNVRDVPGLAVDPDGFARGFIRFTPGGAVSVDTLQVDTAENFAQGDVGFTLSDFCAAWQVRFASFTPGEGSVISFLVNGPRGNDMGDPPTVMGDVYNEAGDFVSSFTIRTDQWAFDIQSLDLVLGGLAFGSIELTIDALSFPDGLVSVAHSAEGRFSVGLRGICKDPPPMM